MGHKLSAGQSEINGGKSAAKAIPQPNEAQQLLNRVYKKQKSRAKSSSRSNCS